MITPKDVEKIASLSRIHLTDEEITSYTKDLESILQYVNKLSQLDLNNVEPTSHVLALKNVYREDKILPSLTQNEAVSIAPEHHNGSFKVPKVIE